MRMRTSPLHPRALVSLTMSQIWTAHPGISVTDPFLQLVLHHGCLQHGHIQDCAAGEVASTRDATGCLEHPQRVALHSTHGWCLGSHWPQP